MFLMRTGRKSEKIAAKVKRLHKHIHTYSRKDKGGECELLCKKITRILVSEEKERECETRTKDTQTGKVKSE